MRHGLSAWLGIEAPPAPHKERLLAALGGMIGVLGVACLSQWLAPAGSAPALTGAMGATAVLLFALPHGALSQPWALFGGHLLSALIGVACARWIPNPTLAAALAVGLAIGAMHYALCLHPPGGATALIAVIGGPDIQALGFGYLLSPVLLDVTLIFAIGVLFNAPFSWRRYPARWAHPPQDAASLREEDTLSDADIAHAIREMGLVVDIAEYDLRHLLGLALQHAEEQHLQPDQIILGRYYSNGAHGGLWSVRHLIDESDRQRPGRDLVIYKVVAGAGAYATGSCKREEFARWARYEVLREGDQWRRVPASADAP